ncbi:hypothetical protein RP29_06100 [Acidovorax temperans]|uniref:Uncharacterized protein n=1 Tax=Acidovorax temperans TaxID=80878 RepID=A0A0D7KAI5_9BURK|nr:hypothetical protein [Acidovorax temperans]KJA11295.1 hypothetical protein RP29_06100 [Acidovorax temperans]
MTVEELLAAFRSDLDDTLEAYLWSDQDLIRYLNDAVQEANERAFLTEDRTTDAVCSISVVPGLSTYSLHPSVLMVKRVTLDGRLLDESSVEALDAESPSWESRTGRPRLFITEQASGRQPEAIRLVPVPQTVGTLRLTVYRGALKPLSEDRGLEKPEIPARFHEGLRHWVYRCAYLKHDTETMNREKALEHEAEFIRAFGERPDANVQRKRRDQRPPIVAINW